MTNKNAAFPNTRWTRIVYALDPGHPRVRTAFDELFQLYWYPIYAYLRRYGYDHNAAEELTQDFFAYAYEQQMLHRADRDRGRFRTFVLICLQNFLKDKFRYNTAVKRGGRMSVIEIDALEADKRYALEHEINRGLSPEKLFEQKLALEIFNGAMKDLESEATDEGKAAILAALSPYLNDDDGGPVESYRAISVQLNIKVGTLKSHAHRFRNRLRELLKDRVDHIVANESEVKPEMQALEEAL